MANELVHGTVGTVLTQAEYEAVGAHVFNSQATGDMPYASSATQLSRLAIGSAGTFIRVESGVPVWSVVPIASAMTDAGTGYVMAYRSTSVTNAPQANVQMEAESTGDMADGFGSALEGYIKDTGAGPNWIGAISIERDGADNKGRVVMKYNSGGAVATGFTQGSDGYVKFGTHSALAAETVSGYITIRDSGGTLRKLGVVS